MTGFVKRVVASLAVLSVRVLLTNPASAATLQVSFADATHVNLKATGVAAEDSCRIDAGTTCTATAEECFSIPEEGTTKTISLVDEKATKTRIFALVSATPSTIHCVAAGDVVATTIRPSSTVPLRLLGGLTAEPRSPGTFHWYGWARPELAPVASFVLGADPATTCTATTVGATPRASCGFSYNKVDETLGGAVLTFTYSGSLADLVSLEGTAGAVKLMGSVQQCPFYPANDGPNLKYFYADSTELIELTAEADCLERLDRRQGIKLVSSDVPSLDGTFVEGRTFRFTIPSNVSVGDRTWEVRSPAGTPLGTVHIPVRASAVALVPGKPLTVSYGVDEKGADGLNAWHSQRSVGGYAVVTEAQGDFEQYVQNTASFKELDSDVGAVAERLESISRERMPADLPLSKCKLLEKQVDQHGKGSLSPEADEDIDRCHKLTRAWRVSAATAVDKTWFQSDSWWYQRSGSEDDASFASPLKQLTFAVFAAQPQPLRATVRLVDPQRPTRVLLETEVQLAEAARAESLPLPIADAMYVSCGTRPAPRAFGVLPRSGIHDGTDLITNGKTRAVNDDDVETGNCSIIYDPNAVLAKLGVPPGAQGIDLLKYFGNQGIRVTLRRDGATEQYDDYTLDPTKPASLRVPVLKDSKNASGAYTVVASLRGPLPPSVIYRPQEPTSPNGTTDTPTALGELEFRANLRPRGAFGWQSAPIRVFVTFPVNFTGIRFPANASELKTSSSSTSAQFTTVQAGVLAVLEPWDYDTGRNAWAIPTRFATGFNLVDVTKGRTTPTWITGLSVALPIVDLPKGVARDQLTTDLALGLFWEADVSKRDWWSNGQHFLVTFGLNVLSLFGSR